MIFGIIVHGNSDGTSEVTNTEKLEGSKIDFYWRNWKDHWKYGYLLVKPKKIRRNYYRIVDDGTIIEALIGIESIVQGGCIKIMLSNNVFLQFPQMDC